MIMASPILLIKNMVCNRCVMAVEEILQHSGISFEKVLFGEVYLKQALSQSQQDALKVELSRIGFELIDNRLTGVVEKIKQLVIKKARNEVDDKEALLKLSHYLSEKLHHEYTYLSSLFSSVEGRTIENYFIEQRIEKAKELIVYGEKNLSEIDFDLEYSSVAHLSNQFKKITGLTPTFFKQVGASRRKSLDNI